MLLHHEYCIPVIIGDISLSNGSLRTEWTPARELHEIEIERTDYFAALLGIHSLTIDKVVNLDLDTHGDIDSFLDSCKHLAENFEIIGVVLVVALIKCCRDCLVEEERVCAVNLYAIVPCILRPFCCYGKGLNRGVYLSLCHDVDVNFILSASNHPCVRQLAAILDKRVRLLHRSQEFAVMCGHLVAVESQLVR